MTHAVRERNYSRTKREREREREKEREREREREKERERLYPLFLEWSLEECQKRSYRLFSSSFSHFLGLGFSA